MITLIYLVDRGAFVFNLGLKTAIPRPVLLQVWGFFFVQRRGYGLIVKRVSQNVKLCAEVREGI